jgi:hypothetical protein
MTDIEDLFEAVFDIENIVEEVADPDDLIADFVANPLMVIFAFTAALASLFLILLFAITLILLVFAIGPIDVLLVLMLLSFVVLVGAIVAFLYVRTDIPAGVYHKINNALEQADDSPEKEGSMTQKEAIKQVKNQYASGALDDYELDQALDDVLTSENPEKVVKRYTENNHEKEREW